MRKMRGFAIGLMACCFMTGLPAVGEERLPVTGRSATAHPEPGDLPGSAAATTANSGKSITNKIVDLLDRPVTLNGGEDPTVWESQSFDTSQFTWIGIRVQTDGESAGVLCQAGWQFAPGDSFEFGTPVSIRARYPGTVVGGNSGTFGLIGVGSSSGVVQGLRAKVACRIYPGFISGFGELGDDPGSQTPDSPISITLRDVKVLLRHW